GAVPVGVWMLVQVLDQHPELRAPVAEMVLPDHGSAEEGEDPGQGVADHRASEVADVHLLGDVGLRVLDQGHPRVTGPHAQAGVPGPPRQLPDDGAVSERQVYEAGPGELAGG